MAHYLIQGEAVYARFLHARPECPPKVMQVETRIELCFAFLAHPFSPLFPSIRRTNRYRQQGESCNPPTLPGLRIGEENVCKIPWGE